MSLGFLFNLLRRDHPVMPQMAQFFVDHCISPQPTIRATAQKYVVAPVRDRSCWLTSSLRALRKLLYQIKCRTYSKTKEELWFEEWRNPIAQEVKITDPEAFLNGLQLTGQVSEKFVASKQYATTLSYSRMTVTSTSTKCQRVSWFGAKQSKVVNLS